MIWEQSRSRQKDHGREPLKGLAAKVFQPEIRLYSLSFKLTGISLVLHVVGLGMLMSAAGKPIFWCCMMPAKCDKNYHYYYRQLSCLQFDALLDEFFMQINHFNKHYTKDTSFLHHSCREMGTSEKSAAGASINCMMGDSALLNCH